jgi:G3E family GTPase
MTGIPVTILGGFLGAGKTTAVNHLLRHGYAGTIVLVNDFGTMDIDSRLITAQEGDIISLANGCVCCSIGPDFSATLARTLKRLPPPARILIEASGVSDPWRIAQLVKLEPTARLAAVIVLVDALTFADQATDHWLADTLSRQIARADIVALTKCDSTSDTIKAAARAAIIAMRADTPIVEIAYGRIPEIILDSTAPITTPRFLADAPDHGFQTWYWSPAGSLDRAKLTALLTAMPEAVLRVKGIIRLSVTTQQHTLQMVGRRWSVEAYGGPMTEDGLVVIGTEALPVPSQLEAWFSQILADFNT